jgi:hypothetical protein
MKRLCEIILNMVGADEIRVLLIVCRTCVVLQKYIVCNK